MFIFLQISSRVLAHTNYKMSLRRTLSFSQITQKNIPDAASACRQQIISPPMLTLALLHVTAICSQRGSGS